MLDMIICKGSHREIGMIIVRLVAHMHTGKTSIAGSSYKVFGEELALLVEVVAGSLVSISIRHKIILRQAKGRRTRWSKTYNINQNIQWPTRPLLNQLRSIVLLPLLLRFIPEVAFERLLAPGRVDGIGDGCKRRDGLVFAGVTEVLSQSISLSSKHCFGRKKEKEKDPLTKVRAPCPPILCPVILTRLPSSCCGNAAKTVLGSSSLT